MSHHPNVVLFGEIGSGKSSLINMITGYEYAAVSGGSYGCTFQSQAYCTEISRSLYNIYDTPGLDQGDMGRMTNSSAIACLHRTITDLKTGINLLVFCMRGPRINDSMPKYWKQIYGDLCEKKVPVLLVVTGLEGETVMDHWSRDNAGVLQQYGIYPSAVACITTTRGKQLRSGAYAFQEEYDESRAKVQRLIQDTCLRCPWRVRTVGY